MKKIRINSYAKINLSLEVANKRHDGYHEVDMIMQEISLHDTIVLEKKSKGIFIDTNIEYIPNNQNNIAYKAADIFFKKTAIKPCISINIFKRIPICAGLGGGSSNAACVLKALDAMFKTNFSTKELIEMAAKIGSDVPFFIEGKTQRCRGRGEILQKIDTNIRFSLLILKPNLSCKTKQIYENMKVDNQKKGTSKKMQKDLSDGNKKEIIINLTNQLEKSTFELYPEVKKYKIKLEEKGAQNVLMSGSGSAVYGIFKSRYDTLIAYEKLKNIDAKRIMATTR